MIDYTRSGGVLRLSRVGRVPSLVCGERWPAARRSLKKLEEEGICCRDCVAELVN